MKHLNCWWITVFSDEKCQLLGNVSAVVFLEEALKTNQMQQIANDMNQPATTFIWKEEEGWNIRWFAPDAEIGLCGHGTMAAVGLFDHLEKEIPDFAFRNGSVSGYSSASQLSCVLKKGSYNKSREPEGLQEALGVNIIEHFETTDKNIVVVDSEEQLKNMKPNFDALQLLAPFGYAVTARGEEVDFVSRTLVPKVLQLEDHATGSSHTVLAPYWSDRLKKSKLSSIQMSRRGGYFECEVQHDQVILSGNYKVIAQGTLNEELNT